MLGAPKNGLAVGPTAPLFLVDAAWRDRRRGGMEFFVGEGDSSHEQDYAERDVENSRVGFAAAIFYGDAQLGRLFAADALQPFVVKGVLFADGDGVGIRAGAEDVKIFFGVFLAEDAAGGFDAAGHGTRGAGRADIRACAVANNSDTGGVQFLPDEEQGFKKIAGGMGDQAIAKRKIKAAQAVDLIEQKFALNGGSIGKDDRHRKYLGGCLRCLLLHNGHTVWQWVERI